PEKRDGRGQVAADQPARSNQPGSSAARLGAAGLGAMVREQIQPCWNIPVAAQGLSGMVVPVNIRMAPDGTVQSVAPVDVGRMGSDPVYR
ncbi:cell envelope integrity protein TolA, partial [Geminicoccus flavidas]|uniref:cell envelope integrity protein TolA n=1 Tax=Geminicoccus flavidas TaxID=2506407 RepID=UPI00190F7AB9